MLRPDQRYNQYNMINVWATSKQREDIVK
jgi:hypothetical protein